MSICGVGIDIADITRIGAILERYGARFENRWFHPDELGQSQEGDRRVIATRCFAVKEAVWKALPHDATGPLPWRAIVTHPGTAAHQMAVELRGAVAAEAASHGVTAITANVTVHGDLVVAVAMVEGVAVR